MATPFATRDARLSRAIERAFGEMFTFLPFLASGADLDLPRIPDASRTPFSATGVWEATTQSATPHARGATQDDNAHNWSVSMPSVSVDDNNLAWVPRMGDRIQRQFDNSIYQISKVMPDGMGRTLFFLTARHR
jgi:hypothetical protein